MNKLALKAVSVAHSQIGKGEIDKNNSGPEVFVYTNGRTGNWCAAFLAWCFEQAQKLVTCGCCNRSYRAPERSHGAKRFTRNVAKLGHYVDTEKDYPMPGDVISWHRPPYGTWRGHVGIVSGYENETDTLITVEGNSGRFPAKVKIKRYPLGKWRKRLYRLARME